MDFMLAVPDPELKWLDSITEAWHICLCFQPRSGNFASTSTKVHYALAAMENLLVPLFALVSYVLISDAPAQRCW